MMKRKYYLGGAALLAVLFALFFIFRSCTTRKIEIDPGFSEYISAFTSGTISVQSNIRFELAKEMDAVEINSEVNKKLFSFSPGIDGKAYWVDNRTIEFRPDKSLKQGTRYVAKFYLNKLIKVPTKFKVFTFDLITMKQAVAIEVEGYQPYILTSLRWNNVTGTLRTADVADDASVEKILKAKQNNKNLNITWTHNSEAKVHHFKVDSAVRDVDSSKVVIEWKGSEIGADGSGTEDVKIPSVNDFYALEAKLEQLPNQYVAIRFSDPIDPNQDLEGLITLDNNSSTLTFEVDKMVVKVYPSAKQNGTVTVNIEKGIKNVAGGKLQERQTFQVVFESIKPAIRLVGKGVILPDSKGLIFPFEAVNLKAVDLRIIKIFENSVSQFLQVNQLDGVNELKRAGRLVLKKTIRLDSEKPIVYNSWNLFSIDLSELIKQEPGAIYRVQLSFKKAYSTYPCGSEETEENKDNMASIEDSNLDNENEVNYWDAPDPYYNEGYYSEYGYDYDWSEREDPCNSSYYYGSNVTQSRNVLASNIGIIAKGASDNTLTVAVANLITTKPMSGVEVEVFNYQHQKIGNAKTDNDGFCTISLQSKPFLLIAKDGVQRGYLRVDDGTALSLSSFDVSGEQIQKGLKGYIYGERGVWRPGDTVFLTFVFEDKLKKLPNNHPVILEVMDPQGKLNKRMVKTAGVNGFYQFNFNTADSDPTGNWVAYIKVGGSTFSKTLKIETIKPNRLKIAFDFGTEILKGSTQKTMLNAKWLHGAPAKNMRANVALTLSTTNTTFKGFEGYEFDDPVKKYTTEEQTVFDGDLDENGNKEITASITAGENAPGLLRANFVTRVFEPGGEFSIDRNSILFSPYDAYVGVKPPEDEFGYLYTDTNQVFQVATVSPEGKPLSRKNLEFKIYKMEWRWWWDSNDNELANYVNSTYTTPVFEKKVSTVSGKAKVNYKLSYPDWGRFLVRVTDPESGHSTGQVVYFDWPGWRGRSNKGDNSGVTMLSFSSDKKSYKVGDKATITVPSSASGRMLVSLETGSEVLKAWWVETEAKETKASFEVTEKMSPNIYVHVSLIQPHAQTINDLPMRMYGVIPLGVEDLATHLYPVIDMPEVMEPEKTTTIKVSEKNNHAMTYTLAIVDEGLLDLTRYKTPDPWTSFYGREALGIKTWDLYDMVMGAFGGKIESLFAIGGDGEEEKKGDGQKANRFKPVVKVLGPFTLKSGSNKHDIKLPQYVGSVRVMVIAGQDNAFGNTEKTVPVRMPLMVLATLPRVVGPGEEVSLPVSVFAMEKRITNFTVEVVPNEFFQLLDSRSQNVAVKEVGEFDLSFRLKVSSREGVGKVKIIARSGNDKAEYDIEINVRNPNSKIVEYYETLVDAGRSADIDYKLIGTQGTNKVSFEVSSIPPIDLSRRLNYLLEYPYGCVEQTTSGAFPQLYLDKFVEMDDQMKKRRENNINYAIQRINSMVVSDGGIGYWPGASYASDWGSSYAGHFLVEAEKLGFNLPSGFKKNWIKYQKKEARNWALGNSTNEYEIYSKQLSQAYRLYTLALVDEPEIGAMNRMKELNNLTMVAAWRLAAAYALIKQPDVAKQIISRKRPEFKAYPWFNSTFGSEERDWAMMLETLTLVDKTNAFTYLKKLSSALSGSYWMSTQSTAYGLMAIAKFLDMEKTSREIKFTYTGGGKSNIKVETHIPVVQIKLEARSSGKVNIFNTGKGMLFARIVSEGVPETGPQEKIENNLQMSVEFKDADGSSIDIAKIIQGTDFIAKVTVWNTYRNGGLTNMALRQVFPSGWEIANTRLDKEGVSDEANNNFTYQDFRDDRVLTFFDMAYSSSKTFTVHLNAAYTGRFYFPGTLCEAMYEPGVNAFLPGKWVEVVKE